MHQSTTVNDIDWENSRRVACVLMYSPHYITLQVDTVHLTLQPQWMLLNGQEVRGLTVYHVDALTTLYHTAGWHNASIIQNHLASKY